jgi:hypothetical protein
MTMRTGIISYEGLPIGSGGAHGLGRLRSLEAWQTALNHDATPEEKTRADELRRSAPSQLGLHASPHERRDYGRRRFTSRRGCDMASRPGKPAGELARPARATLDSIPVSIHRSGRLRTPASAFSIVFGPAVRRLRRSLSVLFVLPFEEPEQAVWNYVAFLERQRLTKQRTGYVARKIKEPPLAAGAEAAAAETVP